ncbi:MAG TPA: hypothetical protein VGO60_15965 [Iamia sp.]|jgi:hypothetical protein|nr:hypothetical protein [Iamia sp.]
MSDFEDTSGSGEFYDGRVTDAASSAISDGTTIDLGTSADLASTSFEATDASFAAWGNSIEADSNATAAYYAGDEAGVEYWNGVSDSYETDSHAADTAASTTWDASYEAQADESAISVEPVYDAGSYDTGYAEPTYDAGYVEPTYDDATYTEPVVDAGYADAGYDASSSWEATDTVTDYYTDADY